MSDILPPGSLNNDLDVLPVAEQAAGLTVGFIATADATVGNTTTETTLLGSGVGSLTLAANSLVVGRSVVVRMEGYITTNATPLFRIRTKLGSTVVADTTSVATPSMGTAQSITVNVVLTCRSTGGSGTVMTQTDYVFSGTTTHAKYASQTSATVTVDTTASQVLDVMATWGTAHAGNTLTITNSLVTTLN